MAVRRLTAQPGQSGTGTTVETLVHTAVAQPGDTLDGVVDVVGAGQEIRSVALTLVAQVCAAGAAGAGSAHEETLAVQRWPGAFTLAPGESRSVPFTLDLPLETPFNVVLGRELPSVLLGVRTELEVAGGTDRSDVDPIRVGPLPEQERILTALKRIGCHLLTSDLEQGRIPGAVLPFHQQLGFAPPFEFARSIAELDVAFLVGPDDMDVLLDANRRAGFLDADPAHRLTIDCDDLYSEDWETLLHDLLKDLSRARRA